LLAIDHQAQEIERRGGKQIRKRPGLRRHQKDAAIFQQQGNADGGDQNRDLGRAPQRSVGQSLDQHAGGGGDHHRKNQRRQKRHLEVGRGEIPGVGAQHVDIAMGEVDEAHDSVHHGVSQRDQGIDAAHDLLCDVRTRVHAFSRSAYPPR